MLPLLCFKGVGESIGIPPNESWIIGTDVCEGGNFNMQVEDNRKECGRTVN